MSGLQQPLMPKQIGPGTPGDPVSVQPEATLDNQLFAEDRFLKVLKELEPPFTSIVKNFQSDIFSSCSYRLGLIVGLEDGSIVVVGYDAEIQVLGKHGGRVSQLCVNRDVVASGSLDKTVRIWSLENKAQVGVLEHPSEVNCVSISSDGKYLISGSGDKTVRVWDLEERTQLAVMEGHTDYVWRVSISPDGQDIVSGSNDKTLRIWSFEEKRQLAVLVGHTERVNSVLISPDGKQIVSHSNENNIRIWSLIERKLLAILEGHTNWVNYISISSDGKKIVSASYDHKICIWDFEALKQLALLQGHRQSVNCVSISDDGKRIVSGSDDDTLRVWDSEEKKLLAVLEGHTADVSHLSISHDGKQVISISKDKMVRIWQLEVKQQFDLLEGHTNYVVSISATEKHIVSGSWDKTLGIWDLEKKTRLAVLEGHTSSVSCLSISANGKQIASASWDATVRIWDLEERRELSVLKHASQVYCVCFSPDGKHIVSGSQDCTVQIWDLEDKKQVAVLEGHTNIVFSVSMSPDGRYVVSGAWDKTLRIWEFQGRKLLAVLEGHTSNINCVSISSDGKFIISGSLDKTVRIWDFHERKLLAVLEGHTDNIYSVAISCDGKHIASGSFDRTIRIWDFEARKILAVLVGHTDSVRSVAMTTDGRQVISGSSDKTICIVDLTMILPNLRSDFLSANFDNKEPSPFKTYSLCGQYQEHLKQGIAIARSVAANPVLPHYFNSLHICAYYNQSTALKDYLEQGVPIIRGVFGSPLTVALMKNSTKCINVILYYLQSKFESNQEFHVLQEIVEDFPKLLVCNASSLVPFFNTLLGTPIQSLPEYIVPLRELPCALFQTQNLVNLHDFAQFEGNELLSKNGELVKFLISRISWNFSLGSAESLEFLRALEDCENRNILITPLINSLIEFKWDTLLLITRTHTFLYLCSLLCLIGLTFNYFRSDVLSLIFIILNVLFLLYEGVQSIANRSDYWKDVWNYVDLVRGLTSVIWAYLVFSEAGKLHYIHIVVVTLGFLRGFTFFRTFKMTRMFVRMVLEVVKEMYAFLVILTYSTISFGMMYAVLMPDQITSLPEAWITVYELLMGTHDETDFDLLKWLCFTATSLMNVIIMLNLLISILGDAYGKAQESASQHDNLEMLKVVIEYESMFFWRRNVRKSSVFVVCKSAEEESVEDEWADRVDNIKKAVDKSLKDTESLLLKKLKASEKSRKEDESASLKKLEAMEKKVEEGRIAMEEKLEANRTSLEMKIDQVLAALQASR